jgi:hypothetical protein
VNIALSDLPTALPRALHSRQYRELIAAAMRYKFGLALSDFATRFVDLIFQGLQRCVHLLLVAQDPEVASSLNRHSVRPYSPRLDLFAAALGLLRAAKNPRSPDPDLTAASVRPLSFSYRDGRDLTDWENAWLLYVKALDFQRFVK